MLRQQLGTQVERLKANNRSMETADTKIRETIAHLGPFHQDIQLSEKLSTGQAVSRLRVQRRWLLFLGAGIGC